MGSTIKDIAKDTNLSLATISKYLNGKNVLPENKKLIEESIRKLGYIPNKTAQNLRSKRTFTICILLPSIGNYLWGYLCSTIEEQMRQYNYSTIIASYDSDSADHSSELQFLFSKQVDGVIIIPESEKATRLPLLLQDAGIPFVCLDQALQGIDVDFVTSANQSGTYEATRYLLDNGHRVLGIITTNLTSYTSTERLTGFHNACNEYQIPKQDLYIYEEDLSFHSGSECFKTMMRLPNPPTAVLIFSFNLTLGAILTLSDLGIRLPEDVSLISFDDDEIFSAFNPPITTVLQNMEEIAIQASQLLMKRISGDYNSFPENILVGTSLIIRDSVKPHDPR